MGNFTSEQVVERAKQIYKKPVCIDLIDEAIKEPTLEKAALMLIDDSMFWDGSWTTCIKEHSMELIIKGK